jgi:hypothetical protein
MIVIEMHEADHVAVVTLRSAQERLEFGLQIDAPTPRIVNR